MPTKPIPPAKPAPAIRHDVTRLTADDLFLFNEGNHFRLYEKLGSHPTIVDGVAGCYFGVWAPNAERVCVMGDFNQWNGESHPLRSRGQSGVWECFIPGIGLGANYKYYVVSRWNGYQVEKADPFAFHAEVAPKTASVVWDLDYSWRDRDWMQNRQSRNALDAPFSIYEVHLGSWRRVPEEGNRSLSYREIALPLAEYCRDMGFTHVELLPVMEHPFYGSWGYQCTGYFAPTSRYGTPQDFMYLVDTLHQHGIGVILDWVPSHFPKDGHGLSYFDGTHLFEHADPRQGFHPEWGSSIFNYGRNEVRGFLMSSGLFWLEKYHLDGLRVDAVASMLYLDYARKEGEWIPNRYGGRENLEAIDFLRKLNESAYRDQPDIVIIAEESTAWPMVSRPVYLGGLGFGMKWNMGWMHDSLSYMKEDPINRKYHHGKLTFSLVYAFNENFVLPLSHDEVVHGKGSLIGKMPGDAWQQFANLRALYGYMWAHPGKKMLFMGGEFAQRREWNHDDQLEWWVNDRDEHSGVQRFIKDLNRVYRSEPALYQLDFSWEGFEWIDGSDAQSSVISFLRKPKAGAGATLLVACNFTPLPRTNYVVGVPKEGFWHEIVNSDARDFGGAGWGNLGGVEAAPVLAHGRPNSVSLTLPPLSTIILKLEPHA